ncbi:hypothetical protein [Acetobacter sp. KSO5]|uniref:hypothetical protein n=1 Tax=Acetobacter sp. KSO5 TaxID=3373674 RepID=UPI00376EE421
MAETLMDGIDMGRILSKAVKSAGGVTAFSKLHGFKPQAVWDTHSLKGINEKVVSSVGLIMVLRYPLTSDPKTLATGKQVQDKLNSFIRECKTQRAAAHIFGIHETTLSNIQNALRGFSPVLAQLGFREPVQRYVWKKADARATA